MASLIDGFTSLSRDFNKLHFDESQDTDEGVVSELLEELELSMDDDELIDLKRKWENAWKPYETEIKILQDENEAYWKGYQHPGTQQSTTNRPLTDNLIFESLETYLPLATKNNPEPMVLSDNTDEGNEIADTVQKMLVHQATRLNMNLKLMRVARYWALYLLGAAKVGWNYVKNDMDLIVPRPQKLILDPNAVVNDDMEYTGDYIGEYRKDTALVLTKRFPRKKQFISDYVNDKLATEIQYIEWWTDDYMFWTLDDEVLGKAKNPHWNYEQDSQHTDIFGNVAHGTKPGKNHFKVRQKPYIFLSVFNLGKRPHDETSLIGQNVSKQDAINKKQRQIDKNADWMNGGWAISGEKSGLTRDQAASAIEAARKGGGLWIPEGNPNEAVVRMTGTGLPADIFNQLEDLRQETRNSFGTRGSTPEGTENEKTVRGKLITRGQDGDRIGGGVSKYLEKFAAQVFNWQIQLMYVYYDQPHTAAIVGEAKSQEYFSLSNQQFGPELTVTVKEGSLIPKDSLTKANQAIDLAEAGLLDPLTLFTRLDDANPKEVAGRTMLYNTDKMAYMQKYFPDMVPPPAPPEDKPPSESISFKDLPPEGQVQMAAHAGIQLQPDVLHQREAIKQAKDLNSLIPKEESPPETSQSPNINQSQ